MKNKFNIGDVVICIDVTGHVGISSLRLNGEYIINGMAKGHCDIIVDIGVNVNSTGSTQICRCGVVYPNNTNIWWSNQNRFVKKHKEEVSVIKLTKELSLSEN